MTNKTLPWGFIGSIGAIIGSFMAWVTVDWAFGTISIDGMRGDGKITAGLAALSIVLGLVKCYGGAIAASVVGGLCTVYDLININNVVSDQSGDFVAHVGSGLYVCVAGFIVAVIGFISASRTTTPCP